MKITGFRSLSTMHDWRAPVGDANGVIADGVTEVPILLIDTDAGVTGVGLGPHPNVENVFPAVDGEDPRAAWALYDRMLAHTFKVGHTGATYGAIGVIDMALWDLKAKVAGDPLWRLLGARDRYVPGYASRLEIAVPDEDLPALWQPWVDRGFTSVKIKGGLDLDTDLRRLAIAREVFGANTRRPRIMMDVNESWHRSQAIRHVREIERHVDLVWIEEPVRRWDVDALAAVSSSVHAGVASGENLTGVEQYRELIRRSAVDVVQTGSCWGITHLLRVATLAHAFDLPVSPVGYNADPVAAAAAAIPNHLTLEIQDLVPPVGVHVEHEIVDGGIVLSDAPGLGITIDEAAIASAQAERRWSAPSGPHVRPADAGLRLTADGASSHSGASSLSGASSHSIGDTKELS